MSPQVHRVCSPGTSILCAVLLLKVTLEGLGHCVSLFSVSRQVESLAVRQCLESLHLSAPKGPVSEVVTLFSRNPMEPKHARFNIHGYDPGQETLIGMIKFLSEFWGPMNKSSVLQSRSRLRSLQLALPLSSVRRALLTLNSRPPFITPKHSRGFRFVHLHLQHDAIISVWPDVAFLAVVDLHRTAGGSMSSTVRGMWLVRGTETADVAELLECTSVACCMHRDMSWRGMCAEIRGSRGDGVVSRPFKVFGMREITCTRSVAYLCWSQAELIWCMPKDEHLPRPMQSSRTLHARHLHCR